MNKSTPNYHLARTEVGAVAFVKRQIDNVEAVGRQEVGGGWRPVAMLRVDQGYLKPRLEERGIECVLAEGTARHVSAAMIGAGAEVLKRRIQPHCGDGFALEVAREVYEAMEAQR